MLKQLLKFQALINRFREVERMLWVNKTKRKENDSEHVYALTMLAWYMAELLNKDAKKPKPKLNIEKVIRYSLVHDLVEVYAGDLYFYTRSKKAHINKTKKEHTALKKLKKEFPDFKDMTNLIESYEKRLDAESKFVYALDKIQPILTIYLDGGRTWKWLKVNLDQLIDLKKEKVKADNDVNKVFENLVILLKNNRKKLFVK